MHNFTRRKSRKKLIIIGSILLFILSYFISGFLKVGKVECYTQFGTCRQEIASTLAWLKNYPILRPLPGKLIKIKLAVFSEIKNISIYRRLPGTVVITISLRTPIGVVGSAVLGAWTVADDTGFLYQSSVTDAYPVLIMEQPPALRSYLKKDALTALEYLSRISGFTGQKISGTISNGSLVATVSNQTQAIIGLDIPSEKWYPSLQLILNRSKMKGKMPRTIDLRFDSSVITY